MFSFYKFNINNLKRGMFGCFYSKSVFILFLLICDFFCCCGTQTYKIIMIGDKGVGKRTLINTKIKSKYDTDTYIPIDNIAQDKYTYNYSKNGQTYKFEVWTTCVNEMFEKVNKIFDKNASGIIAMYDMTNRKSFDDLEYRIKNAFNNNKNKVATNERQRTIPVLVVGNKSDLYEEQVVSKEVGEKFAEAYGYLFLEASGNDYESVEEVFNTISEKAIAANVKAPKEEDIKKIEEQDNDNNIQEENMVVNNVDVNNVDVNNAIKTCCSYCC
ncbi:MAG: GTP-binding protein [Cytophagales bacterium]|nr:GTP-binding protein [Cytophagales bacterium]